MLIDRCLCGENGGKQEIHHDLRMIRCSCSILRQVVMMSTEDLQRWYSSQYFDGVYYHSEDQDRKVANLRLDAYALPEGSRILDVGAGLGSFVEEARRRGFDALGQDLATQSDSPHIYIGALREIAFPPHSFDVVTMHDVLEHVPEPRGMLREIRRILRPGGSLIVDFPRFFIPEGRHHWKRTEHLWMLTEGQLEGLLSSEGFAIHETSHPVPSKYVIRSISPERPSPIRIMVPPGIGDGYWVAVKLRGWLEARGIELPLVFVHDAGPRRSGSFWERLPFVRWGGYLPMESPLARRRGYLRPGTPIQKGVAGVDYFFSLNGTLNAGGSVDEIPGPTEWRPPLFRTKKERQREEEYRRKFGPFVLTAFWDKGFYSKFLREFPQTAIVQVLSSLADSGYRVLITGAAWDREGIGPQIAKADPRFVSMIDKTSFGDLLSLLSSAAGVFGFPAGSTMLGPYFRTPTLLLWNRHFPEAFWNNTVAPGSPYLPLPTRTAPKVVADRFLQMIEK